MPNSFPTGWGLRSSQFRLSNFDIREFDLSPDGREVVLERVQGAVGR